MTKQKTKVVKTLVYTEVYCTIIFSLYNGLKVPLNRNLTKTWFTPKCASKIKKSVKKKKCSSFKFVSTTFTMQPSPPNVSIPDDSNV